jgi:hypothetical protein
MDALGHPKSWKRVYGISQGLPRLVNNLVAAIAATKDELGRDGQRALLAQCQGAVVAALDECGPETSAWLSDMVFRQQLVSTEAIPSDVDVRSACRGAGLLQSADGWATFSFRGDGNADIFTAALRTYCESSLDTPSDLGRVYRELWEIERILRRDLVQRAQAQHGNEWRRRCIPDQKVAQKVVERAQDDGYLWSSIAEVNNPIEWLTTGELTSIILTVEWARPDQLPLTILQRLFAELAPVRNRLAHMRFLYPDDAGIVSRWRRAIARFETPAADHASDR